MKTVIWGAGALTARYIKFGYFVNSEIVGIIDSYKESTSFMGYKMCKPEEITSLEYDYLIICVLRNCSDILQNCLTKKVNLSKIFFATREPDFQSEEEIYVRQMLRLEEIRDIFPAIYRDIEESRMTEQYYNDRMILKGLEDHAFIKYLDRDHIVAWIPIELLFSERQEDNYLEICTDEWKQHNSIWENHPMIAFEPYRNLYQFFRQGTYRPEKYCGWYNRLFTSRGLNSGFTDEQIIEKRFREFMNMQRELNKGMEFFIEHPSVAKWNDKGYFNLVDGHHRTYFLYSTGMNRIPVEMTCSDYEQWCNLNVAKEVHQLILNQKRTEFYQPILNPYFMNLHPYREGYIKSRLHHILEFFGAKRLSGKKIIDIGANLGYMGQAFCRMGAEVTLVEADVVHYELMRKVNQLLYTECKIVTQRFEDCELEGGYDIAILLTVFYHYFSDEALREKFVNQINKGVTQMIIWESGDMPDQEKDYILHHTKFHNYMHLSYTYATGKFRELGLFMVEDSEYGNES